MEAVKISELVVTMRERGIPPYLDADGSLCVQPGAALTDAVKATIRQAKPRLIEFLRQEIEAEEQTRQAEAEQKQRDADLAIFCVTEAAWSLANDSLSLFDVTGYTRADFEHSVTDLLFMHSVLGIAAPRVQDVIRFSLDETISPTTDLLGEIVLASDRCPVPPIHGGAVVYCPKEAGILANMDLTLDELRQYHADKRALLDRWLSIGGSGWIYWDLVEYWDKQASRNKVDPGSRDNVRKIAEAARLPWLRVKWLIDIFCRAGILHSWCPDKYPVLCIAKGQLK